MNRDRASVLTFNRVASSFSVTCPINISEQIVILVNCDKCRTHPDQTKKTRHYARHVLWIVTAHCVLHCISQIRSSPPPFGTQIRMAQSDQSAMIPSP